MSFFVQLLHFYLSCFLSDFLIVHKQFFQKVSQKHSMVATQFFNCRQIGLSLLQNRFNFEGILLLPRFFAFDAFGLWRFLHFEHILHWLVISAFAPDRMGSMAWARMQFVFIAFDWWIAWLCESTLSILLSGKVDFTTNAGQLEILRRVCRQNFASFWSKLFITLWYYTTYH